MSFQARMSTFSDALGGVSPAQWCQAYFVFAACTCLALTTIPNDFKRMLVNYGPRSSKGGPGKKQGSGGLIDLVAALTAWTQVPHSWFSMFYGVSLALSLFWLQQYISQGVVLRAIASHQVRVHGSASMSAGQVVLAWSLMTLQASRRIYENTQTRPSSSQMWVVHWVLGLSFYVAMSVSVWVEGSNAILSGPQLSDSSKLDVPLLRGAIAIPACLLAWVSQYRCHMQLATLKKYSVPEGGLFRWFVCPHYTCECVFYASLALIAAPAGRLCNGTLMTAFLFAGVNLGVTAAGTRQWYADKFGADSVDGKWTMIPFVF